MEDLVGYVEDDLQAAPTVELILMLKALLGVQYQREVRPEPHDHQTHEAFDDREVWAYAEEQLTALLNAAVGFCNDTDLRHSMYMKEGLERL